MAEWALYLDESGTTDPHSLPLNPGQSPLFTLAGVALPLSRWRDYDRRYLYLKREFFAAEIERSSKIDAVWEVKGSDLLSPRNSGSERNATFVYRVLDLVEELGGRVVGVTVLKGAINPTPKTTIYTKALQIIAERYAEFLKEKRSTGVMILDSRMAHLKKGNGLDYTVAVSYLSFIFGNEEGRLLRPLIEAPLFADSGLTAGLQIADIISALTYTNSYRERLAPKGAEPTLGYFDYSHTKRYWLRFKSLVFESQALHAGHRMFGLRTLDHRDSQPTPAHLDALVEHFK
ncbi:DUF3800 domain-containing protein [Altererythrobacter fulvus]|uniref:DUF3800 domain-containing protein n=1 Tax=Caenibius fulvus TaxID=2126012 RepID=UPI003016B322